MINLQEQTAPLLLQVLHLKKSYHLRPVLRDLSFSLEQGERVALLGPSGCGKTTLLHCLGGIDRADEGSIEIQRVLLDPLSGKELTELRRRSLGMIFQFFHLLPTLSVFENIEFPLQLLGVGSSERHDRVMQLIEEVGLQSRWKALPAELSGGEMQRTAIARAIIHRPALLLADEPTGNLDSLTGEKILHLLEKLSQAYKIAMLMVTHSPQVADICHRVIKISDGVMIEESSEKIKSSDH